MLVNHPTQMEYDRQQGQTNKVNPLISLYARMEESGSLIDIAICKHEIEKIRLQKEKGMKKL
ncbi:MULTISPECIES: hypothetical protein [unclassified Psychrobacillus]|uniref:hypothetical protein n=1 Tax=unclassified Psychrobacillus TaxID=2636677 RepID=UPI0030F9DE0D